ncbi:fructose-bisphosphate aldolase [Pseudonocardia sulfidoxydans NBRC 16205]|uniref:fructose-bisphosphate aldolase n=1 Tax=Pseudonocardia sulfidoxydans NBRC 16205 TaxID=1223511 RepID=A0A511DMW0_9PSEU|nr:class I fructose-bisphosphate aldolase [Pseudonocardia sulfidoxydans]GEL26156.1 fructose-bisphosphate aldolase [Pseudonocardia sulfidoxydans NBRC 16205]
MGDFSAPFARLIAAARGLLALDQADTNTTGMLRDAGVPLAPGTARAFRDIVLATPGLDRTVNGILLDPATLHRIAGSASAPALHRARVPLGVRMGDENLRGFDVAGSVDGISDEIARHRDAGASFARWRVVATADTAVTELRARARLVAGWAATCVAGGLTPFVDVVVIPGARDGVHEAATVHGEAVRTVLHALRADRVHLADVVLGSSIVTPGRRASDVATAEDVARATLRGLHAAGAEELAGVVFTAGGRPDRLTAHLAAVQWLGPRMPVGYCLGRSTLGSVARAWGGRSDQVLDAQTALIARFASVAAVVRAGMSEEHRRRAAG